MKDTQNKRTSPGYFNKISKIIKASEPTRFKIQSLNIPQF